MVDISAKNITHRTATARGKILFSPETKNKIIEKEIPKGDIFTFAKAAAMLAAKQTWALLPHCHPLTIENLDIQFQFGEESDGSHPCAIIVTVEAKTSYKTGLEMEALTAVSVALLTIYDMLKPVEKNLIISEIRLTQKSGGKSDSAVPAQPQK